MRGDKGGQLQPDTLGEDQVHAYESGKLPCLDFRLWPNGHFAIVRLQHTDVLLFDIVRTCRVLESRGSRPRGRRRQFHHDLDQRHDRRPHWSAPGPRLHSLGHGSRSPGSRGGFPLYPRQYAHSSAREYDSLHSGDRRPGLYHLVRLILRRLRRQLRVDEHRFLPHGDSSDGDHVDDLLQLGPQHHRIKHLSVHD